MSVLDLIRLGRNAIKRNWTRTAIALAATALAAWMLVVSNMIPRGYPWGVGQAERAFIGGDLVIWPLPGPISPGSGESLALIPWEGLDWQSHALYYLHHLPDEGYVSGSGEVWRAFDSTAIEELLRDVSGIEAVEPYVAIPCFVGSTEAILRARDPLETETYPLSMDRFAVDGQYPHASGGPGMPVLLPNFGGLEHSLVGTSVDLRVPEVFVRDDIVSAMSGGGDISGHFRLGLDWDRGATVQLEVCGKYRVDTNDILARDAVGPSIDSPTTRGPDYWDRPEVFVTREVFDTILSKTRGSPSLADLPTYEVLVSLSRMSEASAITDEIVKRLGGNFAVYAVPELRKVKTSGSALRFQETGAERLIRFQSFLLSGVIVTGSAYIMLVQEKKKIGLLRVIGATSKDVMVYVLTIVSYVAVLGAAIGFAAAKVLSIWALFASEITIGEWLHQTALDFVSVFGMSLGISLILGAIVGIWAARIPSAEVLKRE